MEMNQIRISASLSDLWWSELLISFLLRSAPAPDAASSPGAPGAPEGEGGPPGAAPNLTSNRRLQQTQAQVDEVRAYVRGEVKLQTIE